MNFLLLQVIYIPDKNYVPTSVARSVSPAEPMDIVKKSPVVSPVGSPRPTMVSIVKGDSFQDYYGYFEADFPKTNAKTFRKT